MKDVNSRFGKGSLMKMGSQPDKVVCVFSAGSRALPLMQPVLLYAVRATLYCPEGSPDWWMSCSRLWHQEFSPDDNAGRARWLIA